MKLKQKEAVNMNYVELRKLWNFKTKEHFNTLCVGTLFRQSGLSLVVGGEDGVIRIFDLGLGNSVPSLPPQMTLETKSGPVQTVAIHDVTKFYHNDLIVGDSRGILMVFCNQQILSRQSVSTDSINCLQIDEDSVGSASIVTSNDSGVVSAVLPSGELWRVNLNNLGPSMNPSHVVSIKCILAADLADQHGKMCRYILVADDSQNLLFLQQGTVVMTTKIPASVTAMSQGHFLTANNLGLVPQQNGSCGAKDSQQVALGSVTGAIYILHNFFVTLDEYANAQSPITNMSTIPQPDAETDLLVCSGHFNSLIVYQEGKVLTQYPTPDWVNTIDTVDIDQDGAKEIVIGCLDNSIHAVKIS